MVEIMFIEVKSANDRLDAQQEDWLYVLDGVCNARICKYENTKAQKKKEKEKKWKLGTTYQPVCVERQSYEWNLRYCTFYSLITSHTFVR